MTTAAETLANLARGFTELADEAAEVDAHKLRQDAATLRAAAALTVNDTYSQATAWAWADAGAAMLRDERTRVRGGTMGAVWRSR